MDDFAANLNVFPKYSVFCIFPGVIGVRLLVRGSIGSNPTRYFARDTWEEPVGFGLVARPPEKSSAGRSGNRCRISDYRLSLLWIGQAKGK